MQSEQDVPQPPSAPEIRRRLQLTPWQWIGLPILAGIPLLALFGLFGETRTTATERTAELSVEVNYPTRNRYRMLASLRLEVTNTTDGVLDRVTVALDPAYAGRFSNVVAIPDFEDPYTMGLLMLEPGETRRVRIELQGERYGRHRGDLRVTPDGAETARLPLGTFVFP